jgi:hypothetical protein
MYVVGINTDTLCLLFTRDRKNFLEFNPYLILG